MIIKTFPDIKTMWERSYFGMLDDEPGFIDYYQRNILHSYQNHVIAKSAVFDFDLGDIGLTQTKWSKFTGQYVDVEQLHAWVNNAMNVKTYDALWTFRIVPPNFTGKKAVHQWGNCLLGFSFRRQPKPATLTLFTRAQSIGFSGVADYALADFVARKLAERMGIDQEKIRFQVYCPNFMIKTVEAVSTLYRYGRLPEFLEKEGRIGDSIRYYKQYMDRPEEEIRWRAARRWRTKLINAINEEHKSLPVANLNIKGWHGQVRTGRRLTSQQASMLVLTGQGRRGTGELVLPDEAVI
jgi:hypothetical protein